MDNKKKKRELKKFVYSIRLTEKQNEVLKKNECIKRDLDQFILQYINSYL